MIFFPHQCTMAFVLPQAYQELLVEICLVLFAVAIKQYIRKAEREIYIMVNKLAVFAPGLKARPKHPIMSAQKLSVPLSTSSRRITGFFV